MKLTAVWMLGMVMGGAAVWLSFPRRAATPSAVTAAAAPAEPSVVAAAQGRVEGRTEDIEVEASADGVIRSLAVHEGQRVAKNEVIGQIACDNLDSEIRALEALRESAKQARTRLLRGSREEERRVADQEVVSAQAIVEQARRNNDRMQILAAADDIPRQSAENAKRDLATAESALRAAMEKQKLVNAGPLPEEIAKADADVVAAAERLQTAIAQRDKCVIRAPITGTITRVHMRAGQAFSTVMPHPIVTMTDLSEQRIRAEVDERDLSRIAVNQSVRIRAEGFQEPFAGKVIWTSVVMGRKTVRSKDPAEKSDRDILEALILPERTAARLPVGLRVVVEFLGN
ncbi:MAG TPA: efflux RND transporter periplasmic adaptor subunit [Candidatus Solibacter sp.]|nr:efflux RND transporter periplasmic adaptor subunit [Candidatus Solibacter sp.]